MASLQKFFNEAKINELMIKQTTKVKILVADHRKIGLTSKFKIADITAFDCLITDKHCSSTLITELRKTGKVIKSTKKERRTKISLDFCPTLKI